MSDYQRIAAAIAFIKQSALEQPSLDEVADHIGLSPYHFQRLFKRFAGVSPKRFLQHLTSSHAKTLLRTSKNILDTSFAVGLSSPSRLHDLLVSVEAVTPGEYKTGGENLQIEYGFHSTPFGRCLLATTKRGICRLDFYDQQRKEDLVEILCREWPNAIISPNENTTQNYIARIFNTNLEQPADLHLLLHGTNFQIKVWQALLKIPAGAVISYGSLAARIGHPRASRAVGTAVGKNPIGYLIPCHRVLRENGDIGGYRWGTERKLALLGYEYSRTEEL